MGLDLCIGALENMLEPDVLIYDVGPDRCAAGQGPGWVWAAASRSEPGSTSHAWARNAASCSQLGSTSYACAGLQAPAVEARPCGPTQAVSVCTCWPRCQTISFLLCACWPDPLDRWGACKSLLRALECACYSSHKIMEVRRVRVLDGAAGAVLDHEGCLAHGPEPLTSWITKAVRLTP